MASSEDAADDHDDAGLALAAQRYREALTASGRLTELPLSGYDRTGVPVWAAVHDPPQGPGSGPDAFGVGYGASDVQAQVGALGELAERVVLGPVLRRLAAGARRAAYAELLTEVGPRGVVDPLTLVLPAGSPYTPDTPLAWVPAQRWGTGETVLVPAELAAFDTSTLPAHEPPGGWLTTPVSNGLGAGEDLERAVSHALLELVQRDGDTVDFKALDTGVVVDLDGSLDGPDGSLDDGVRDAVARLRAAGVEPVVKLAPDGVVPVVFCHGRDEDDATPAFAVGSVGEAAHPDAPTAVRKALLEMASSRARRVFGFGPLDAVRRLSPDYWAAESQRPVGAQEERALAETARWARFDAAAARDAVAGFATHRTRTVPLASLPRWAGGPGGPRVLLAELLQRLAGALDPLDVLVVASDPQPVGDGPPVRAVKVLVPTLEVETLSYARVGERVARRLLDRGSPLVTGSGPSGDHPGRRPVRLTAAAQERLGGPVWFDVDAAAAAVGPLYALYREPRRHAVERLGATR